MPTTVSSTRLPANGLFIKNSKFEQVPTFTAATTAANRFIDGTATGSQNGDLYGWAIYFTAGTVAAQFDTSTFNTGTASLKLSTQAVGSQVVTAQWPANNAANIQIYKYLIPCKTSTSYTVTYWMKTNYVSGASTEGAYCRVRAWQNATTVAGTFVPTKVSTTTNWTQYSVTFTTTAATAYLSVEPCVIGSAGAATLIMNAWFDDINLVENNPAPRAAVA